VVSKGVQGSPFLGSILVRSLLLALLFVLSPFIRSDAQGPKSVFVKATCDGTLSVAVVNTFKEEIRTSKRYQLISTLDDNRRMDVVIDVRMSCVEQDKFAAIAAVYGVAKCFGPKNCHVSTDGNSVSALLCSSNGAGDCGRILFKAFDTYASDPSNVPLKLQ
jgi:hypothetical protein